REALFEGWTDEDARPGCVAGVKAKGKVGIPKSKVSQDWEPTNGSYQSKTRWLCSQWLERIGRTFSSEEDKQQHDHDNVPGPDNGIEVLSPRTQGEQRDRVDEAGYSQGCQARGWKPYSQPNKDLQERAQPEAQFHYRKQESWHPGKGSQEEWRHLVKEQWIQI